MAVPGFLLRKLYKRGSLKTLDDGTFAFTLQNPLANATLLTPPDITVNGIHHPADEIDAGHLILADISEEKPFLFKRGSEIELHLKGRIMKSNRIHVRVLTKEFDDVDFLVEDHLRFKSDEEE